MSPVASPLPILRPTALESDVDPASTAENSELDLLLQGNTDAKSYDAVDKLVTLSVGEVETPDEEPTTQWFSWRTLWAYAGPGWLMSIAYVDPGNLESDLQAGAYGGYQLIWVLFASTVMGFYLQVLAARLGVVTGRNLAEMCTMVYPRWASLVLWCMTEIAIVGSDIQEVLGSAIAFQILFKFPLWLGCLITGLDTFTFLALHRYGIRKLEAFFVTLIGIMLVCFVANFLRGGIEARDVAAGFLPEVQPYAVTQAVGIVGAVIMPHNIFLHSALVQTRKVDHRNTRKVREANKYFRHRVGRRAARLVPDQPRGARGLCQGLLLARLHRLVRAVWCQQRLCPRRHRRRRQLRRVPAC
ncbi:hypothetical protein PINS_up014332 [Pythium insidiosum]|nr:hypothetical protein PINS_up014332 [Pythium insidiosum]